MSCYQIASDTDGDIRGETSDWSHVANTYCDLDAADGYDFSGTGIADSDGKEITGHAHVVTDSYPYVMPFFAGAIWNQVTSFDVRSDSETAETARLTTSNSTSGPTVSSTSSQTTTTPAPVDPETASPTVTAGVKRLQCHWVNGCAV
jgi:hypothetical protein